MKELFKKYLYSKITQAEFEHLCGFMLDKDNSNILNDLIDAELESSLGKQEGPIASQSKVYQKILQQVMQDQVKNSKRKLRLFSIGLRVAALLVCGLIFSSIWFFLQSNKVTGYVQMQTVSIPYGAKTQISMPDGSTVWLNSGTTMSYSGDFSKKRQVELKGEAFFDVQKGKIPFEVKTGFGTIKVLGTSFNVMAYPESGFATTLVQGSVQIDRETSKQWLTIKPGQQVKLIGDSLFASKVETELFTSWKDGKMIFRREPFPNLMKRLERWYNVKIEYKPEHFKDLWYSGSIENETITEVMEMIGTAAPVQFTFNSKTRIIQMMPRRN